MHNSNSITAYPRCHELKLAFVKTGPNELEGFSLDDIEKAIPKEVAALKAFLANKSAPERTMFSCGHRKDAKSVEILCVRAADLEAFLEAEPKEAGPTKETH